MNKEKQIEEMTKDLKENLRLCAGVKLLDHQVETIAYELSKKYQLKLSEDGVVLTREEYERLKRAENEKDRLYEIKLDLENQLIERGWTDYEGADEIEKRVCKETVERSFEITKKIIDKKYAIETPWTKATLSSIINQIEKEFTKQFGVEAKV